MPAVTVNAAALASGWSPRMLRYIEQLGLVAPARTPAGYRVYAEADVVRLGDLRDLRERHGVDLAALAAIRRLHHDHGARAAVSRWLAADAPGTSWLDWEQTKQQRLLAAA